MDKDAQLNILQLDNWDILIQIWAILKLFYKAIKYIKKILLIVYIEHFKKLCLY